MILIGLTGGIGAGKSEVVRLLQTRGAEIVDADVIVRELQQPGTEVFEKIVALFGNNVVDANGQLDRNAIATIVFNDEGKLKSLNGIVHPAVREAMNSKVESFRSTNKVVILDIPLLVENPREGLDGVLVVDLDTEIAISRLIEQRKMKPEDARARVAKQATRDQRRAIADHIIDNSGDRSALGQQVDDAWSWIISLK